MKVERHGYRFTNKKNSSGGKVSTCIGAASLISVVACIVMSVTKNGNAGLQVGMLGAASFLLSTVGLIFGMQSFKEKDRFYLMSWIGSILNAIVWLGLFVIITWGYLA